jgi:acyl-CoA dehydrogenase
MQTVSNVQGVPTTFAIDEAALAQYLKQSVPWFHTDAGLSIRYFSHGQSNPTYLVASLGQPKQRLVLRKQPPGPILPSAHRVLREATIMRALQGYLSPVPRIFSSCASPNIIGTPFFLMQFMDGVVFPDYSFPDLQPTQRLQIFRGMADTLAAIHSVPYVQAGSSDLRCNLFTFHTLSGLAEFGSPKAFLSRQIKRWSQQFDATIPCASPTSISQMRQLHDFLTPWGEAAAENNSSDVRIVHGDFGIHNIVWGCNSAGASATYRQCHRHSTHLLRTRNNLFYIIILEGV